jgi:hypothetical protein
MYTNTFTASGRHTKGYKSISKGQKALGAGNPCIAPRTLFRLRCGAGSRHTNISHHVLGQSPRAARLYKTRESPTLLEWYFSTIVSDLRWPKSVCLRICVSGRDRDGATVLECALLICKCAVMLPLVPFLPVQMRCGSMECVCVREER